MSSSTEYLKGDKAGRSTFSSISAIKLHSCTEELTFFNSCCLDAHVHIGSRETFKVIKVHFYV